ncbi:hypothetical protein A4X13_0g4774 [Tilletia indica]|uniref:Uncharacterized protein n=1 Tax=Tilletia indica TaxID=43049 RepID=A0A177TBH6_9BASI|nr:hypothetical protein A4X13_0g4774 [Tilletia indica]
MGQEQSSMPPIHPPHLEAIRGRIVNIEIWRDAVFRACRRRRLAQYLSRGSEEPHPAWSCSLLEYTYQERVAEFFEWMNEKRWTEDWTAEKEEPIQALLCMDVAIKNGRDDLPTAHERMKEHLAAGNGMMPFSCQYHSGPAWAPFPFGSPRQPDGYEPYGDDARNVSPEPMNTPPSPMAATSEEDWAEQARAMALERAPAQADTGASSSTQNGLNVRVPHPGGSWIVDWRRSETGATVNHVASTLPGTERSVDSVSTPGRSDLERQRLIWREEGSPDGIRMWRRVASEEFEAGPLGEDVGGMDADIAGALVVRERNGDAGGGARDHTGQQDGDERLVEVEKGAIHSEEAIEASAEVVQERKRGWEQM